jgi:hypothetical protein
MPQSTRPWPPSIGQHVQIRSTGAQAIVENVDGDRVSVKEVPDVTAIEPQRIVDRAPGIRWVDLADLEPLP